MTAINIDNEKVQRMIRKTLQNFSDTGAHHLEVVFALSGAVGQVIAKLPGNDIAKRETLDHAIKYIAKSIEANTNVIQH